MKTKSLFNTIKKGGALAAAALMMSAFSNDLKAQELSFGPKIGFTSSTLAGNDVPDGTNSVSNFTAGVFFKANAGDIVSFQPEILYAQRGATTTSGNDPDGQTLDVDYLQIPVLIKAQVPIGETIYPFVYAGPYGAFELSNNYQAAIFDGSIVFTDQADVNDFDFGAVVGLGMDFQVNSFFLGFDARYDIGMSRTVKIDGEEQDMKNRAFTLFASFGVN
ncbi:MAG: porin family protein, partial [Owenweeksia sp.]